MTDDNKEDGMPENGERPPIEGQSVDDLQVSATEAKTALAKVPAGTGGLDILTVCKALAQSGYFKDTKQVSQAVVKVLYGQELGLSAVMSMVGIHIIEGKPGLAAATMATLIKRSRVYDYAVKEHTDQACEIEFFERATPEAVAASVGTSRFTMEDAKTAGLIRDGSNWKKWPRNMVFARAMSNGAKWYCAAIFGGPIYTPEELEEIREREVAAERHGERPPAEPPAGATTVSIPTDLVPAFNQLGWRPAQVQMWLGEHRDKSPESRLALLQAEIAKTVPAEPAKPAGAGSASPTANVGSGPLQTDLTSF